MASIRIILLLGGLLISSTIFGQDGDNPFEVVENIEQEEEQVVAEVNPKNPFEVMPNGTTQLSTNPINLRRVTAPDGELVEIVSEAVEQNTAATPNTETKVPTTDPKNPFDLVENGTKPVYKPKKKAVLPSVPIIEKEDVNISSSIKLIALLVIVGFLAFLRTSYNRDLQLLYRSFTSANILAIQYRDKGTLLRLPDIPLYILLFLTGGAMVYLIAGYYEISLGNNELIKLLLCIGGIGLLVFIRHFIMSIMANVFSGNQDIKLYNYTIGIFYQMLGLILIPFLMIVAFSPPNMQLTAIYITLVTIVLFYSYRLIRLFPLIGKSLVLHKFHFILYLCTVEIAPVALLVKMLYSGS